MDTTRTGAWIGLELSAGQRQLIRERTGHDAGALYLTVAELIDGRFERSAASLSETSAPSSVDVEPEQTAAP